MKPIKAKAEWVKQFEQIKKERDAAYAVLADLNKQTAKLWHTIEGEFEIYGEDLSYNAKKKTIELEDECC